MKLFLIIAVALLLAGADRAYAQTVPKENAVKITVSNPRGTEWFDFKASKAWWKLFAGTDRSLPELFKVLRGRADVIDPASVPKDQQLKDPNVIRVRKAHDPRIDDCATIRAVKHIVESQINSGRKVIWAFGGKYRPCDLDERQTAFRRTKFVMGRVELPWVVGK